MAYEFSRDYARQLDAEDPLRSFRDRFLFPRHEGEPVLYFCGNSLGLQPKSVRPAILHELDHWAREGVEGHFRGELPWMPYHQFLQPQTAHIAGATEEEVVVMNTLTTNLHLLMVSFYRPSPSRFKIIMEAGAFPSDQYAVESQVSFHGFDPGEAIVEVEPRPGEEILHTDDILQTIEKEGEQTALVLFSGVQYFTGQFFDLEAIARKGHDVGACVGFDLAHAAGNVVLNLHDWGPDFATWCSYKYLNSGPGGPSGVFVHERHAYAPELPRFAGWWGHDEDERFLMRKGFKPMRGAAGWQLSNAQIFSFAAHRASLDLFAEAGMENLRRKSEQLTGYLAWIVQHLNEVHGHRFQIITPADPAQRGCQLSLLTGPEGKALFDYLGRNGLVADWREYNLPGGKPGGVIRLAPVPLYNTFEEVWTLGSLLAHAPD